jgi:predicted CopG family antitoxin
MKRLDGIKNNITYSEVLQELLNLIKRENIKELQDLFKNHSDFDNPDKLIELFSHFNALKG